MSQPQSSNTPRTIETIKKVVLSTFVVSTFAAYVVHENHDGASALSSASLPSMSPEAVSPTQSPAPQVSAAQNTTNPAQADANSQTTNSVRNPSRTMRRSDLYQDGQYTGPTTDAYYGNVQVEAIIQNGKLIDVRFLDYPHDRRTSIWINQQVAPWLRQEAIQAQSANVNIISGATLTSEAFIQSLSAALDQARG